MAQPFTGVYATFNPGDRIRLKLAVDTYPLGIWEPGETGTFVTWDESTCCAHIKLDKHYPVLDEWDNELHVCDWQLMNENPDEDGLADILEVINDENP